MGWRSDPGTPQDVSAALDADPAHALAPEDYWPRLVPHLRGFGISRVADITGLDRIGLPVMQAVRPMARSNAVTQGKAASPVAAALGAVLECLEMAAGEQLDHLPRAAPRQPDTWTPLAPGAQWPDGDTAYLAAWNLTGDAAAQVPRDLISTDFSRGAVAEAAPILRHSIGLGAGATPQAALMHGLWEAIEADARLRSEATGHGTRLTPDPDDPAYGALLRRLSGGGFRVALHDLSRRPGQCVVAASVMEEPGPGALPLPASGYAARGSFGAAIAAALSEAVQARLAVISGAREDITQRFYIHGHDPATLEREWAWHGRTDGVAPETATREWTVRTLACAVGTVLAVPLHWDPDLPLAITRIVAPALIADPLRLEPAP